VFDRLTNSNKYTGTQKTRHEEIKSPRSNTGSTKTEDTAKSPRADATKSPRPTEVRNLIQAGSLVTVVCL
jgi:hypothetical protein